MLSQTKTQNILFLDIETVTAKENFEDLDTTWQTLWAEKTTWQKDNLTVVQLPLRYKGEELIKEENIEFA